MFLVIDELDITETQYMNVLVRFPSNRKTSLLHACKILDSPPNKQSVIPCVDDAIRELGVDRLSFNLLLTNKASYMRKAANSLKQLYPGMFLVTSLSHLLHTAQCL